MLKRIVVGLLLVVLLLAAALAVNTWRQGSRQLAVQPLPALAIDKDAAAQSLSAAVRARTVSGLLDVPASDAAFAALQAHLQQRYPLVHGKLERERVGAHTLLYTWKGSDTALRPIALMAHQDVVPIAPGTDAQWKHPPWGGAIAEGYVWGRGTWDNKGNLIA
jgi:carboxypeptidase PM20D1